MKNHLKYLSASVLPAMMLLIGCSGGDGPGADKNVIPITSIRIAPTADNPSQIGFEYRGWWFNPSRPPASNHTLNFHVTDIQPDNATNRNLRWVVTSSGALSLEPSADTLACKVTGNQFPSGWTTMPTYTVLQGLIQLAAFSDYGGPPYPNVRSNVRDNIYVSVPIEEVEYFTIYADVGEEDFEFVKTGTIANDDEATYGDPDGPFPWVLNDGSGRETTGLWIVEVDPRPWYARFKDMLTWSGDVEDFHTAYDEFSPEEDYLWDLFKSSIFYDPGHTDEVYALEYGKDGPARLAADITTQAAFIGPLRTDEDRYPYIEVYADNRDDYYGWFYMDVPEGGRPMKTPEDLAKIRAKKYARAKAKDPDFLSKIAVGGKTNKLPEGVKLDKGRGHNRADARVRRVRTAAEE